MHQIADCKHTARFQTISTQGHFFARPMSITRHRHPYFVRTQNFVVPSLRFPDPHSFTQSPTNPQKCTRKQKGSRNHWRAWERHVIPRRWRYQWWHNVEYRSHNGLDHASSDRQAFEQHGPHHACCISMTSCSLNPAWLRSQGVPQMRQQPLQLS